MLISINIKNILTRALWTFVQGAIGAVAVVPAVTDLAGWKAVGAAAVAGGLAALISFVKTVITELISPTTTTNANTGEVISTA